MVQNHCHEQLLVVIVQRVARQALVGVTCIFRAKFFPDFPGSGRVEVRSRPVALILAAQRWCRWVDQMLERLRGRKSLTFWLDIRPSLTVQLPSLSVLIFPVVIRFVRFRSLGIFVDRRFACRLKHELHLLKERVRIIWILFGGFVCCVSGQRRQVFILRNILGQH